MFDHSICNTYTRYISLTIYIRGAWCRSWLAGRQFARLGDTRPARRWFRAARRWFRAARRPARHPRWPICLPALATNHWFSCIPYTCTGAQSNLWIAHPQNICTEHGSVYHYNCSTLETNFKFFRIPNIPVNKYCKTAEDRYEFSRNSLISAIAQHNLSVNPRIPC